VRVRVDRLLDYVICIIPIHSSIPRSCSASFMASSKSSIVFDDIFTIDEIDKEGKKFDRGML
jgi:hypothetical protein